ncbi:MAG: hypothetical protein WDN04_14415 [Rhodospirillales bacterium]
MRGAARCTGLFLVLALVSSPCWAELRPRLAPARDVTVDYTVQPAGRVAVDVRVEILAGGQHLRITSAELPTTFLVNRTTGVAAVLLPILRAYSEVSITGYDPEMGVLRGAVFARGGRARVAGRDCTLWRARSAQGQAHGCITEDGVILQGGAASARNGELGTVRATRVAYGAPPRNEFEIPAGFQRSPVGLDAIGPLQ